MEILRHAQPSALTGPPIDQLQARKLRVGERQLGARDGERLDDLGESD